MCYALAVAVADYLGGELTTIRADLQSARDAVLGLLRAGPRPAGEVIMAVARDKKIEPALVHGAILELRRTGRLSIDRKYRLRVA